MVKIIDLEGNRIEVGLTKFPKGENTHMLTLYDPDGNMRNRLYISATRAEKAIRDAESRGWRIER